MPDTLPDRDMEKPYCPVCDELITNCICSGFQAYQEMKWDAEKDSK